MVEDRHGLRIISAMWAWMPSAGPLLRRWHVGQHIMQAIAGVASAGSLVKVLRAWSHG